MTNPSLTRSDLLRIAAEYADFCVLVTTSDLDQPGPQVLYVNSAFTGMTGYSPAEIVGKTPRILQGPDTDQEMLVRLKAALHAGKDFIARTTNYRKNGESFEIEWIISHLRDAEGRSTHYVALQRDITGVNRAQEKLAQVDEELRTAKTQLLETTQQLESIENVVAEKARFAALGEIAAGVVHDLSNALTPVFGLVELLHSVDSLPEEAKRMTGELDVSIEHALNLLSTLRDYHIDDSGDKTMEPVDLRSLVQRIPDLTKSRWAVQPDGLRLSIDFAFDIQNDAVVLGSEVELLQVLINLVLNAIDAMPDGGTITLGLVLLAEDRVRMSVSDSGVGMSEEMAERCFKPYVKGRSDGTGLGLAVCKRIIEAHGGTILAVPLEGRGAKFEMDLPASREVPALGIDKPA